MLYERNGKDDLTNVLAAIDGFAKGLGLPELSVDVGLIETVLTGMRHDFPAQGGSDAASPFKKAANFLCYFLAQSPVKNPFSADDVGSNLAGIRNHQNAMVGLHIVVDALHMATIDRKDGQVCLENRIKLSAHSYQDAVEALVNISPSGHFHLVSVYLEQLCYRFNPMASYNLIEL